MYRCCIFDLDGTLLDTLEAIAYTCNMTLAAFGLGPIETEHYKVLVGNGAGKLIEQALTECGDEALNLYEDALALYQENFAVHSMYQVHPYDGIEELLNWLKEKKIKIGVLSNKPHARTVENIETFFGRGFFDHIQGEQAHVKRKPDPAGVEQILHSLGMEKKDCLYIGDTNTDMMTARNAGVDAAGVTWGFREEDELRGFHPAYIVHHPMEISRIIAAEEE